MDKLKGSPTIIVGNTRGSEDKPTYAGVLSDLQNYKETQTAVNKVNNKLNAKWEGLISDIERIISNNQFTDEFTQELNTLKDKAVNEQMKLEDIIREIEKIIEDTQERINGFTNDYDGGNTDSKDSKRTYNSTLKDLKKLLKKAGLNYEEETVEPEQPEQPDQPTQPDQSDQPQEENSSEQEG